MKQGQFTDRRSSRAGIFDSGSKSRAGQFHLKSFMSIGSEGVIVAESIIGECVTFVNEYRIFLHVAAAQGQCNLLLAQHT
jgi:hypothetical protein